MEIDMCSHVWMVEDDSFIPANVFPNIEAIIIYCDICRERKLVIIDPYMDHTDHTDDGYRFSTIADALK